MHIAASNYEILGLTAGQEIAYARMNGVVPPWTARRQQQQPKSGR
jgi:hypothetical protein